MPAADSGAVFAACMLSAADVHALHFRIGADCLGIAFDQHLAFVHHGDLVGDCEDAVDVVLHQQHGHVLRKAANQCRDALALGGGESHQRFVEQQRMRLGRQRNADFHQALAAVRQIAHGDVLDAFEAEEAHELARLRVHLLERAGFAKRMKALARARLHAEPQVLPHAERREQAGDLERSRQPAIRDRFGRQALDVRARPASRCRASGANMPETMLNSVVLPAPLGPISACSRRSAIARSTASTAVNAAEALGYADAARRAGRSEPDARAGRPAPLVQAAA